MKEKAVVKRDNKFLYWSLGLFALAIVLFIIYLAIPTSSPPSNTNNTLSPEQLAKCLTDKGIKMYGSITCPHCTAQKALFGEAFKFVNYIECTESGNSAACSVLSGVPAWDIQGKIYYGSQELSKLKELSGC